MGCDIHLPYLRALLMNIYDDRVLCTLAHLPFRDRAFGGIACIEVLEHLERKNGEQVLDEFERTRKGVIVISTPLGFRPRAKSDDNPHQAHRSGWYPSSFKKRSYKVRYLPRFSGSKWSLFPLIITWRLGIMANTILAFKYAIRGQDKRA